MSEDRGDLDLVRAEAAAREYFAAEARTADFTPLDPALLRQPPIRRGWRRIGLAAAACLVAALVIVPLALRLADRSVPVAATPEPPAGFGWTEIAPAPLGPRFGALTAWIDGEFYLAGGWAGGPCPPGAMCDMAAPELRDGARYDPATDAWTPIAEAPLGLGRDFATTAVVGTTLYVTSFVEEGSFLAYDAADDRWRQLATPPFLGRLVATDSTLMLIDGGEEAAGYRYDPAADSWTAWARGPLDACLGLQGFPAGERVLVLGECGSTELSRRTSYYDPAAASWTEPVDVDIEGEVEGDPVYLDGRFLWPDPMTPASSLPSPGILDTSTGQWQEVDASRTPGPLAFRGLVGSTPHLVLDGVGLVTANGRLLQVANAGWVDVPDLPGPDRWDPVAVAGTDSLLTCFGYEYLDDTLRDGKPVEGCHLLSRPA